MGLTITEKILAAHVGKEQLKPGEIVNCSLDMVLANDITGVLAIQELKKMGYETVYDPERIAFVLDHLVPNPDMRSAENCMISRNFAQKVGLKHFFDLGNMGIEHALLPEQGLVLPGDVIIGGDSHTCTYGALGAFATGVGSTDVAAGMAIGELWFKVPESIKFNFSGTLPSYVTGKDLILFTIGEIGVDGAIYSAMEFSGEAIANMSMDERFTICNMAIEAGAKTGIISPDNKTKDYIEGRVNRPYQIYKSDPDACYENTYDFDVSKLEPQVAMPHLPSNVENVSDVKDIKINQVIIGSCTNGRIFDMREAARILKGRKVANHVRTVIIPATQEIYLQALKEGLLEIFVDSGAAVSTPTCGPCFGGHTGILAEGEKCVSTTNRNFVGRMGHPKSEVFLASPAVAAASAIKGEIASPWEVE